MKSRFFISFILILSFNLVSAQSFRSLYKDAFALLEQDDYETALPILLEMHDLQPNNANTKFSIGICYMNSKFEKVKAIPFLEEAQNDLNPFYESGLASEKKAPLEVLKLLGQAYHQNYEFDKAIDRLQFYRQFLDEKNLVDIRSLNRSLRISEFALQAYNNPNDFKIAPIDDLNTEFPEYRPKLNAEENLMFFTSRRSDGSNSVKDPEGNYYEDIFMSVKEYGVWTDPILVQDKINSQGHDACLYLSPDAQLMYVYRFNTEGNQQGGIYQVKKEGDNWGELELLESSINSKFWETDASLDTYGNIIFFTSDRDGGYGGRDIWMMKRLPNGQWAEAQNLGENINTIYDEEGPYLHPDGKTLYFSSQGHQTMGGHDFLMATMNEDGSFSSPINMGYPTNTVDNDLFFFPSVSGTKAYFSSYRQGGKGDQDIYVMNLVEEEEKDVAVYKGVVRDTSGNVVKDLVISIFEENSDSKYGVYRPNVITGRFLFILQAGHDYEILYQLGKLTTTDYVNVPAETEGVIDYTKVVTVNTDSITITAGKVVDGDIVAIAMLDDELAIMDVESIEPFNSVDQTSNEQEKPEQVVEEKPEQVVEEKPEQVVEEKPVQVVEEKPNTINSANLPVLYFVYEATSLIESSKKDLDKVYDYLVSNPSSKINIMGHTDSKGEADYNKLLSKIRANSIKNYLNNKGIGWSRMKTTGLGESQPVADNEDASGSDNSKGRQQNRRVEFEIIQ
jgi:outer membrane protein OmpA-like peptidoglycan-associated protein/tetratricopeptide (TPR) repeat protein